MSAFKTPLRVNSHRSLCVPSKRPSGKHTGVFDDTHKGRFERAQGARADPPSSLPSGPPYLLLSWVSPCSLIPHIHHPPSSSPILHLPFPFTLQLPQSKFSNHATYYPRSRKVALHILEMLLHVAEIPGSGATRSVDYFHAFAGLVPQSFVTLNDHNVFSAFCFAFVFFNPFCPLRPTSMLGTLPELTAHCVVFFFESDHFQIVFFC